MKYTVVVCVETGTGLHAKNNTWVVHSSASNAQEAREKAIEKIFSGFKDKRALVCGAVVLEGCCRSVR